MTVEEALDWLKSRQEHYELDDNCQLLAEALNLAIKALEQKPCKDCVSRKALLDLATIVKTDDYSENDINDTLEVVEVNDIKQLPSVNPKLNTSWIPCSKELPKKSGKYWCTFGGTNITGEDRYITESDAKEIFDEPEEYVGWRSKNVIAWIALPEAYKESEEENEIQY